MYMVAKAQTGRVVVMRQLGTIYGMSVLLRKFVRTSAAVLFTIIYFA